MVRCVSTLRRRIVSISGLLVVALALLALVPVWLPITVAADVIRRRWRLPVARLLLFGIGWAWLELAGVAIAFGLWITGQRRNREAHHRLQTWWAANLVGVLRATTGIKVTAMHVERLQPGPAVLVCRHASLADSLVSAWVLTSLAGMRPRYVLKRELLADPCLDIVGNRLPNHFLDRQASDSGEEIEALTRLSSGMGGSDIAVIFPEGTRASPSKREQAIEKLSERDPQRARRLRPLQHLLPPRSAGAAALLAGAPDADVVVGWHTGFDGLDTFGGILKHLARTPAPVRFDVRRIPRSEVPSGPAFTEWLDDVWLQADREVHEMLEAGQT